MPETASPDNVPLPVAQPDPSAAQNEPVTPPPGDKAQRDVGTGFSAEENGFTNGMAAREPDERLDEPKQPANSTPTNGEVAHDGVNGHVNGEDEARPLKRRRTHDSTPPPSLRKPKPISPPWKRIDADGPTSFTENGRRKSGRINTLPLELQTRGKKRLTRGAINGTFEATPKKQETAPPTRSSRLSNGNSVQKPSPAAKPTPKRSTPTITPKSTIRKPASEPRVSSRSLRRRTPSPPPPSSTRQTSRLRRTSRLADADSPPKHELRHSTRKETARPTRINLRVSRSSVIPLVHPDQARKRPKIGESFEDFWARAGAIAVEEGGLLASEDGPAYTDEIAEKEARTVIRIEDEAELGGLLSQERCSLFVPEALEEPPRQWARQDHMVRAMANFRRLLIAEQQRHKATAKRLAEACRDEWIRRQPKTTEQLEAEARILWMARYRAVAKAVFGTWENVRAEVNRRRLEEWEAEEQRRVKAALNEAVNQSEMRLQAQRVGLDSELPSDEDGFDDLSDDASLAEGDLDDDTGLGSQNSEDEGERGDAENSEDENEIDSDNMSSSEDEDVEDPKQTADENLTQEELRAKYANIPDLERPDEEDAASRADNEEPKTEPDVDVPSTNEAQETSDESVDMDDDMGSSDEMDSDDDEQMDGSEDEDEDDSEDEAGGLLGFFGKSELKKLKEEVPETEKKSEEKATADVEMKDAVPAIDQAGAKEGEEAGPTVVDEDEVSLVQHPDSEYGDPTDPASAQAELTNGHHEPPPETTPQLAESETSKLAATENLGMRSDGAQDSHVADVSMVDVAQEPVSVATEVEESVLPKPRNQEDHSSDTNQPTDAPSRERSNPPPTPPTSETKPSDHDATSTAEPTAEPTGDKPAASRSVSVQPDSGHKTEVPFLLRGTLREYQRDGLDWLAGLYANNTNGILADEMGLGKTIQTIALLAHLACQHEVWGPHLVIVPTSVMLNWEMEFKKWCPGFKILAYYGSQEERKRKRQGWNNDDVWNVCITSYQLVLQDQQVFKRRRWHYMILDEAHNIKNFKSQRWQTLLGFNTHSRLLLTGTPLQNNLTELWSLLFFLMPSENGVGGFADLQEFHDWFHKPESQILESGREQMDEEARAIISKLHKVLRPYLLRRLKADVEKQMPAKYEHVEFCRLSKRQRELYDGFLSRADTKHTLASGNYMSIINCLMQLRKVCNHPDLFVDRPITTSFRMARSVASEYESVEQRVQRTLLAVNPMSVVDLGYLNLIPTRHEHLSIIRADRIAQLSSHRRLNDLREAQKVRAQNTYANLDPSTVESNIAYLESAARWGRFEELQHCVYLNALRRQQRPIYGKALVDLLTIGADKLPCRPRPKVPAKIMSWFEDDSTFIRAMIPTLEQRAGSLKTTIEKFSCVTPAVVTRDVAQVTLGRKGIEVFTDEDLKLSAPVRWAPFLPKQAPLDPWHEARMRLSIQFPDKRLLQYDCGKLQVLDKLLRRLQTGGHRALIFTQMTKVLDILEQFLNIHGHKYLRLDGATKVEQRQILTDRFNHDPRILCFILSTRSGGLGINLTGADTVIFYDQDWNPAMDKQCQDRCHRIGQTRDVHIYRLISEHTIEANILRKASQKQMLDDVVIQEGEFTTDYFNKMSVRDVLSDKVDFTSEGVSAADAALDRVLGGPESGKDQRTVGRVLEQAEDKEDVAAARVAEKEIQADDADFTEKPSNPASGTSTARQGTPAGKSVLEGGLDEAIDAQMAEEIEHNAWGEKIRTVDEYMLGLMAEQLKNTKLELPKDKKKGKKKGKDTRKR
ncbi:adenosinetriphosphatase [Paramyrothecium foliicola]|nr:adenosinetriphosphatase [Paramyrothecium foliicola]